MNLIAEIDKDSFKDLENLKDIKLDNNKLDRLDKNTFSLNFNLISISLHSNPLAQCKTKVFELEFPKSVKQIYLQSDEVPEKLDSK